MVIRVVRWIKPRWPGIICAFVTRWYKALIYMWVFACGTEVEWDGWRGTPHRSFKKVISEQWTWNSLKVWNTTNNQLSKKYPRYSLAGRQFLILCSRNTFWWGAPYYRNAFIFVDCSEKLKNLRGKNPKKSRDWIVAKKERRRRQGRWVVIFFSCKIFNCDIIALN